MKPTSRKVNWNECGFCGKKVIKVKTTGGERVLLNPNPVRFIMDGKGDRQFWYNKQWVRGRLHFDGLKGYEEHRCYRA